MERREDSPSPFVRSTAFSLGGKRVRRIKHPFGVSPQACHGVRQERNGPLFRLRKEHRRLQASSKASAAARRKTLDELRELDASLCQEKAAELVESLGG